MKTYTVVLDGQVLHDGRWLNMGDRIIGLDKAQVERLRRRGVVGRVIAHEPAVVETGPELIVGMTVGEATNALALIKDAEFIGKVIELEAAKGSPRVSLIEAAKRRLAELGGE